MVMRGSICKRKYRDGTVGYCVIYDDLPGPNRERRQKRISGFLTKKHAERKLLEIRTAMQSGRYYEPTKLTVRQYAEKWLQEMAHTVRARTLVGYKGNLIDHVSPRLGHMPMWAVQPQHLKDLYDELLRE